MPPRASHPFLEHPLRGTVRFDERRACFVRRAGEGVSAPAIDKGSGGGGGVKWLRLRGLKELLREVFFPNYNFEAARRVATKIARSASVAPASEEAEARDRGFVVSPTGGNSRHGLVRGEVVHAQLADYISLPAEEFSRRHPRGVHPFAYNIARAVQRDMGLRFIAAEEPVYSAAGHFATAADALAVDAQGRIVVLEFKCGMASYIQHANDTMKGRHLNKRFTNSPLNQAYLQLMCTAIMLAEYYGVTVHASYVIHATESGINRYPLPTKMLDVRDKVYAELCRYAARTHEDKSARKRRRRAHRMKRF